MTNSISSGTMRALVKTAAGPGHIELRTVDIPQIRDDEVLIRVAYVGICGSDLHIFHDTHPNHPPVTLGHEFSGVVEEVGVGVEGWAKGDRVVSELHGGACGRCRLCRTGDFFACPKKRPIGWWTNGAYADFIAVPAWLLHRIPDQLPLQHAALTEPLAVCLNALQRAPITPESMVAVIGPGPIGLLAGLAARAAGARAVMLVGRDSSAERLALAQSLGIEHIINTSHVDPAAVINELTDGLGADTVIETAGSEDAVRQSIAVARKLGTVIGLGVNAGDYRFPWNDAVFKALKFVFSFSANYLAFEQALSLLASGRVPAERIISGVLPLEEWREAFDRLERREALKLSLRVGGEL